MTAPPREAGEADIFAGGGEMGELMRTVDWARTPIGPPESWPQSLRTALSICLASRFPILIWWGPDLVMLYNDAYRPMLGATKHPTAMGQTGKACWPEIWDIIGPMLEGVITRGDATWSADQMLPLDRNGYVEECYFTFSYSPIRDETGGIGGVFTAVTETTGRVLGERRLWLLRELATRTADAGGVEKACTIVARTLENDPADVPFAALYLYNGETGQATLAGTAGLRPGSTIAPAMVDVTSGDDVPWRMREVIETGQDMVLEPLAADLAPCLEVPPDEIPCQVVVLPMTQAGQDAVSGLLVVGVSPHRALDDEYRGFFDLVAGQIATAINEARAYEEERRRAEALAELDRAKTAFFSNISHEFRTPLTLLLGPLEDALSETAGSPSLHEQLEIAHRNGLRLLRLVNTLLDFSRIEAGRIRASYEPTDLGALTSELASAFRSAIERAGLELAVEIEPIAEPVYVDRDMWEKIVLNLLSNAFKFTFEGGITVALRRIDGQVELEVRDTGTGIPEEELPRIFERFHRVHGARSRSYEGTGIGLALIQELAHLHGGEVRVASRMGEGATFTVILPLGSRHLPAEHVKPVSNGDVAPVGAAPFVEEALRWLDAEPGEAPAAVAPEDREISGAGPANGQASGRILVVDDNADMRDYLVRLLAGRYDVQAAADGEAALEVLRGELPDLIVTDIMMPRLDGLGLLRTLRASARTAAVPVILLSARAGEDAAVEGLEAGADDYLVKPFTARELLARVHAHAELARTRRLLERQRSQALSTAAHDLKNPLTSIRGFTQLLQRQIERRGTADVARIATGLERIEDASSRMMRLINEMLAATRYYADSDLESRTREVDLPALADRVVAEVNQAAGNSRIVVHVRGTIPPGRWDPDAIERVLGNLLSNAVAYSPPNSSISVTVSTDKPNWVRLTVQDHGIGIPREDLPHVFEPFYRARNVPGDSQGSGIGLAGVRQIIQQHGGAIDIVSHEGEGTTVTVRLPLNNGD